jgi:Flp pilus assembly protein TadD
MPLIYAVLENYPEDPPTLNFLGYIWLMGDKPALAYQMFRRALQESPGNKALWTSLGSACHEMDMLEDALKYFLKSAELDPSYALAYSNAAAALYRCHNGKMQKILAIWH